MPDLAFGTETASLSDAFQQSGAEICVATWENLSQPMIEEGLVDNRARCGEDSGFFIESNDRQDIARRHVLHDPIGCVERIPELTFLGHGT